MRRTWEALGRRLSIPPAVAACLAAALLAASLGLGLYSSYAGRAESVRQARVQAEILAGSLAAPLAFDDVAAMRDYLEALRANPAVEAAGVYGPSGRLAAAFRRGAERPPEVSAPGQPVFHHEILAVTAPVVEGTTRLGSVYLSIRTETFLARAARYLGIGLVVLMGSLLVVVLSASHARLSAAHRDLQLEIAERQKAEAALRQAQKMEAMGQLTGGVAHDFNNLLMVASSGLDLMERTTDEARRKRLKEGIRQAIDRGAKLTQQLLAFARKTPLKSEVADLAEQLRQMENVLDRSLREDIVVRIEAAPDRWPVEVDLAQFEVAVLNICINARDAMPAGGSIGIRLDNLPATDADRPDFVRVAITDTGSGMPPEVLQRIFEPFFTTKGPGQGTGLGLSQVYGFAQASGGDVQVESAPGSGTTVSLLLPRSTKSVAAPPAEPPATPPKAHGPSRVLLVEDDDRVANLVGEMLVELDYAFHRVANANAALDVLKSGAQFDLVFSDMVMPGEIGGLDLARRVIDELHLPVLLTSGYSASAAEAAAQGLPLLIKPYRIEVLAGQLAALLQDQPHAPGRRARDGSPTNQRGD